jgi:hypothetical protein
MNYLVNHFELGIIEILTYEFDYILRNNFLNNLMIQS